MQARAIADGEKGAVGTGHSFILCVRERERESKNSDFALIEGVGRGEKVFLTICRFRFLSMLFTEIHR